MGINELKYLMTLLDDRQLKTIKINEIETIVALKSKIRQMIYDIEDGKDGE